MWAGKCGYSESRQFSIPGILVQTNFCSAFCRADFCCRMLYLQVLGVWVCVCVCVRERVCVCVRLWEVNPIGMSTRGVSTRANSRFCIRNQDHSRGLVPLGLPTTLFKPSILLGRNSLNGQKLQGSALLQ